MPQTCGDCYYVGHKIGLIFLQLLECVRAGDHATGEAPTLGDLSRGPELREFSSGGQGFPAGSRSLFTCIYIYMYVYSSIVLV